MAINTIWGQIVPRLEIQTTLGKKENNMEKLNKIKLFQEQKIRTHWEEKEEKWYFSIIDIIEVLTDQKDH